MDAADSVVDPYSRCGRIVPIYTFFTISEAPQCVPVSFLSNARFLLAITSALLICVFPVCLLSKVIPRYVALSVCYSSVSSNIIFMGLDLVDKVKCVVKYLVLFIFTHFLIRSLMSTKERVGDMTPPCGSQCVRTMNIYIYI